MKTGINRREFGKLLGAGGLAVAAPGVATGLTLGTASPVLADHSDWQVTGKAGSGLGGFDTAIHDFMKVRNIPCGALAVVKDDRLVLARGYTHGTRADEPVEPTSLFRVASLSKAITSTAISRLIQDGQLGIFDSVTDRLDLTPLPGESLDPRLEDVTVRRLMQHLGGWDRSIPHPDDPVPDGVSGDITWRDRHVADVHGFDLPLTREQVLSYGAGRPLHHDPGTTYAYSNYGYWLLGEIVAARSGVAQETYIQDNVLTPMGITRMRPGQTFQRQDTEVPYFSRYRALSVFDEAPDAWVHAPYGSFNLENRLAGGGWLASAVDYVRFAQIFDGGTDVLDDLMVELTFSKPENHDGQASWYGHGWSVHQNGNTWHSGSLPGTATAVTRRYDGITWAVLFDQRDDADHTSDDYDYTDMTRPLHTVANQLNSSNGWPSSVDYFSDYF